MVSLMCAQVQPLDLSMQEVQDKDNDYAKED